MKIKPYVAIFALVLFVLPRTGFTQEAVLSNMSIANTRDQLLLYLNVKSAFTDEVEKAILSGVSTTFSFLVVLNRERSFWVDEKIAETTVHHTIK